MILNTYLIFRPEMNSGTILGYFLQALPIACIVGIVFFVMRFFLLRKQQVQIRWGHEILLVIYICYLVGLTSLIVLPANFWLSVYDGIFFEDWGEVGQVFRLGEVNLVPSVAKYLKGELSLGNWVKKMLIGNIAMFIPFGLFLPLLTKIKSKKAIMLIAVMVPICFEVTQLIFGRSFDVDDLICNSFGIIIGALLAYTIWRKKIPDAQNDK